MFRKPDSGWLYFPEMVLPQVVALGMVWCRQIRSDFGLWDRGRRIPGWRRSWPRGGSVFPPRKPRGISGRPKNRGKVRGRQKKGEAKKCVKIKKKVLGKTATAKTAELGNSRQKNYWKKNVDYNKSIPFDVDRGAFLKLLFKVFSSWSIAADCLGCFRLEIHFQKRFLRAIFGSLLTRAQNVLKSAPLNLWQAHCENHCIFFAEF